MKQFPGTIQQERTPVFYQLLKREIKQVFGREIATARECLDLADDIYKKLSLTIHFNTLRRFFGLVKANYDPSAFTVDVLCRYCGYSCPEELVSLKSTITSSEANSHSMFQKFLVNLLDDINTSDVGEETIYYLMKITLEHLNQCAPGTDMFQRAVFKTANGLNFYVEKFIYIDQLNSHYGNSLLLYINGVKTPEQKAFGYALLCLKHWLTNDDTALIETFGKLQAHNFNKTHPLFCGLYYAASLLHADVTGMCPERILIEAYNDHAEFTTGKDDLHKSFELLFSRVLIMTGHFDQALYYIGCLEDACKMEEQSTDQTLLLLKGIALCKNGQACQALIIFNNLNTSGFYFLSCKTDRLLYHHLAKWLKRNIGLADQAATGLMRELGFKRLVKG